MAKELYKTGVPGEDVAYLLGQIANQREISTDADLRRPDDRALLADRRSAVARRTGADPHRGAAAGSADPVSLRRPADDPAAGDAGGHRSSATSAGNGWDKTLDWWPHVPSWQQEVRDDWQLWEREDPEFMTLWQTTRQWSLDELRPHL